MELAKTSVRVYRRWVMTVRDRLCLLKTLIHASRDATSRESRDGRTVVQMERDKVELLTARPGGRDWNSKPSSDLRCH